MAAPQTAGRRRLRWGLTLLGLSALQAFNARAGGECDVAARSVALTSQTATLSVGDQTWSGTGPFTVAELWGGRSVHLELDLGAQPGGRRAILWCGLLEASLVRGAQPLETACAGHFVRVAAEPVGDGGEAGDAGVAQKEAVFILPSGTVEVLEVAGQLFDEGGRARFRFQVPTTTVTSSDGHAAATLTLTDLDVDATFAPLPDCGASGCGSCGLRYGGWLPGGG